MIRLFCCAMALLCTSSAFGQTIYEAESGIRNGSANLENGGQYVGNLGNGVDNWVEIRNVSVSVGGTYRVTVSYASGDDSRALTLRMNGNDSTRVTQNVPNTGGWNTTGTIIYEVVLQSGINIIRFYNANTSGNTYAPPVDKISVPANPSPVITASGTLAAVNTIFPNASPSPTSFNVSGTNLTTGITVTAPTRFEVSTAVNGTYASTATIAGSGTISSTPVFVRLAANTPVGTYSGNLVLSSSGATSVNVATVSSSVTPWTYSFGSGGNVTSFNYNGSTMPNLGVSALTKNGVTSASSSNNFFASSWGTNATTTGTLDPNKYFEFTITASQGFTITNPAITFGVGRSTSGPRRFEWRSSLDNYATAIPVTVKSSSSAVTLTNNMLQVTDTNNSRTGNTVSLTTSGQSQITFRFYAYWTESTSGTGGLAGDLTFSGTLVENPASPMIAANGTLAAVSTTYGTASTTPTSFTVSGADMTEGIKVTPPAGFEVSTGSTFASGVGSSTSPITIGSTGTIAQTTVYVRLAATAPVASSPFSGNIVLSSAGATSVNVATVSSVVSKATPTITTAPTASAITFGQTLASSTLSGGSASTAGSFAFTTPATDPNAGTASQNVTFTPTDSASYNTATTTVSVTVIKATPTISTAPTASAITYGQTLADSTLSGGIASTAGTFAFTTPATAPNAGTASQSVTFTPSNTTNFNTTTTTVSVTVNKATPTITTAPTASPITYGQTLESSTLSDGTASVPGTFAFTLPTTAPNAGTASQGVTFTPTDAVNYNTATGTVDVTVAPRNLTITGLTGTNKVYDRTTTASASGTAALDGVLGADIVSLSGTPAFAFVSSNVGTGIAITTTGYTLSGTNAANYSLTQPSLTANITAKSLTITGLTGNNKAADGTTNATASGTAALQGVEAGDSVSLAGTPVFTFATAGVGTGITITTTGYTLAGENAGNYTLTQPLLSANILDAPVLVTGTAGSITRTTAQISGNQITSDGGSAITERGVVFSTNAQPTVSDTKVAVAGEIGAFAASLSGLTGGTTYYVRAYATNALTTVYGSAISFTANATPVFSGMALTVTKGGSLQIIKSKLRPRITDPESDPITITGAAATSQRGGTVTRSNRVITYTPSASFSGNDTFAVTVDDGFGASNITLTVAVTEDPLFTSAANAPRITTLDGGAVRVTFNGIPGRTYGIQRSTTMAAGSWTQISAVTAGSNSVVTFDDPNPPSPSAFYRIAFPAQ